MKGSDLQGCWVKCYRVKCHSVRAAEKLKIGNVTNDMRANLSSSIVWFKDEPDGSWWTCNTPGKSHQNERDPKAVQVWDYIVDENLKKIFYTTYINKIHLLFDNSSFKNLIVKHVFLK